MAIRESEATWNGLVKTGNGTIKLSTGLGASYTYASRFGTGRSTAETATDTNPEELLGAAHAACFSMAMAAEIAKAGFAPEEVRTVAKVHLDLEGGAPRIARIHLHTRGRVPTIDRETFQRLAESAKEGCPLSKALEATEIEVTAELITFRSRAEQDGAADRNGGARNGGAPNVATGDGGDRNGGAREGDDRDGGDRNGGDRDGDDRDGGDREGDDREGDEGNDRSAQRDRAPAQRDAPSTARASEREAGDRAPQKRRAPSPARASESEPEAGDAPPTGGEGAGEDDQQVH